jgi:hypothetical protein
VRQRESERERERMMDGGKMEDRKEEDDTCVAYEEEDTCVSYMRSSTHRKTGRERRTALEKKI